MPDLTPEELHFIAEAEHRRWVDEVRKQGWKFGERRDDRQKTNPHMVAWSELDERSKELTMNAVRDFPQLMSSIHVEICRRV
jgi:hypothetical protein